MDTRNICRQLDRLDPSTRRMSELFRAASFFFAALLLAKESVGRDKSYIERREGGRERALP